ncbi:MAG: ribonuclease J [Chloroflexota bacterium]
MAQTPLRVTPLGGSGEIGKSMMVVEFDDDIVVIDVGCKFPEEEMRGIDLVIPDFTYLVENRHKIQAILITHGHEDHIGALPYFLPQIEDVGPIPIYGSALSLAFARSKLDEARITDLAQLVEVEPATVYQVGRHLDAEFIPVTHSIPGAMAVSINSPVGRMIHTGDFKFDRTPPLGPATDEQRLRELGDDGVLILFSDATRIETPGRTPTEMVVSGTLDRVIGDAPGRVLITSFASNISRLQQAIVAGERHGRKVAVVGRSMEQSVRIALDLGYIEDKNNIIQRVEDVIKLPEEEILILTTGSQGEAAAALSRMASGDHPTLKVREGDTVILSATPVPGNEETVAQTINALFKSGAKVIYSAVEPSIHVSGHAAREELKHLISITKPRFVSPIHGEYRHLHLYREMALESGIRREDIIIPEPGMPIELKRGSWEYGEEIKHGAVLVDAMGRDRYRNVVLRSRESLADAQVIIVTMAVDLEQGILIAGPELTGKGFDTKAGRKLLVDAERDLERFLERSLRRGNMSYGYMVSRIKDTVARFVYQRSKERPMILPVVTEF